MSQPENNSIEIGDWVVIHHNGLNRVGYIANLVHDQCEVEVGSFSNPGYEAFGESIIVSRSVLHPLGVGRWTLEEDRKNLA